MKKNVYLLILALSLLLAACGSSQDSDSPTSAPPLAVETTNPQPYPGEGQPATPGVPSEYPAPPTVPSGYPEPPPPAPTRDPYPGGRVVMYRAMGEQCADESNFESVEEAVAELEGEGITVLQAEAVSLVVCSACGCPTSEQVRVELDPADLASAQALGWLRE